QHDRREEVSKYTPDEDYIIAQYVNSSEEATGETNPEYEAEARRGIARMKAEAWDEGVRAGRNGHSPYVNPYREEAGL
ncbi:hypothetical protein, partial [Bacillus subtilis]|uniref:hypothetical protein n=1 Tax=Bacillus subtilis TaxID=1423 RepID=UPI003980E65E